ncbi:MAG: hypothetical protein LBH68_06085 [Bifidobacteriaceae bacterium]|jgi:hypothetical protein|nr:hypothetical protein [Bifidobacteriaceae bacterium]
MALRHVKSGPAQRLAAAALTCAVLVTVAACAEDQPEPRAFSDRTQVLADNAAMFQDRLAAMDRFIAEHNWTLGPGQWDVLGSAYTIILVDGEVEQNVTIETGMMGNPAATYYLIGGSSPETSLNSYHPAGSDQDYVLLGEALRDLAPTPWITRPTLFPPDPILKDFLLEREPYTWSPCAGSSYLILCGIRGSMFRALAEPEAQAAAKPEVTWYEDGSTMLSVTVPCWSLSTVDEFPGYAPILRGGGTDEWLAMLANEFADQPVLIRIWQASDGEPVMAEINGELTDGKITMQLQGGWTKTGVPNAADFPAPPNALDVTNMTDEEFDALMAAVDARREELGSDD